MDVIVDTPHGPAKVIFDSPLSARVGINGATLKFFAGVSKRDGIWYVDYVESDGQQMKCASISLYAIGIAEASNPDFSNFNFGEHIDRLIEGIDDLIRVRRDETDQLYKRRIRLVKAKEDAR